MNKFIIAAALLYLVQPTSRGEEPAADPIAAKITAAKDAYYAERDKAEQALIVLLEKKEAAAKQAGDIKTIEAVRAESEAFRKGGKLPKSVPLTNYETAMKLARTKLENVFLAAIKSHTVADRIDEAKALQQQWDEIFKGQQQVLAAKDPFQVRSEWVRPDHKIVVTERKGDSFKAIYTGPKFDREINGTCKDGKFEWLAKDSRILRGEKDANHRGEIVQEQGIYKMKVSYGGGGGRFEMQLKQK